jgi:hypothetical protein
MAADASAGEDHLQVAGRAAKALKRACVNALYHAIEEMERVGPDGAAADKAPKRAAKARNSGAAKRKKRKDQDTDASS